MERDDFLAMLDAMREFIRREVIPREAESERDDDVPESLRAQAAAMDLFGYAMPTEHGGLGLTALKDVELARIGSHDTRISVDLRHE